MPLWVEVLVALQPDWVNLDYISVSEVPVDIFEETPETENIINNLGSLPLHIRQSPLSEIYTADLSGINRPVIKEQQQDPSDNDKLADSATSEELSVKTLANMFDFRLSDPSMSKNLQKLIRESKLDSKYSSPIDVNACSEC